MANRRATDGLLRIGGCLAGFAGHLLRASGVGSLTGYDGLGRVVAGGDWCRNGERAGYGRRD